MATLDPLLRFRLDRLSGVPAYRQLFDQVHKAIRLGHLQPEDRLPSVREVVEQVAINPNTVYHAYRELEHAGLVEGRHGSGTYVASGQIVTASETTQPRLFEDLLAWVRRAIDVGLHDVDMNALLANAIRNVRCDEPRNHDQRIK